MNAGDLRERISLRRLNETTGTWDTLDDLPEIWAAVDPQGDGGYRVRIRYRDDLYTKAHLEPALRMLYRGEEHDVTDVMEVVSRHEVHLTASRRIIEDIMHLASGARRIKAWP